MRDRNSSIVAIRTGWALLHAVESGDGAAGDALVADREGATDALAGLTMITLAMIKGAALVRHQTPIEIINEALSELRNISYM